MRGVYLLHFSPAYKHAKHYTGYAEDIERRVAENIAGKGAHLCAVALAAGCKITLVRTWPDQSRTFERKLKNRKNAPRLCPICHEQHAQPIVSSEPNSGAPSGTLIPNS